MMSRVAPYPTPSTSGLFAVNTISYSRSELKPLRRQMRVGSGVPGKGAVLQSAQAQSALGMRVLGPSTPVMVCEARLQNSVFVVSVLSGWYGAGVVKMTI